MPSPFPERLGSSGCELERWRVGDEEVLGDLVARSLEHLRPYMDFAREEPGPPEVHRALLERWEEDWLDGRGCSYQVLDEALRPCGVVSIHAEHVPNVLHVGYWLAPWAVGSGRMSRAVALLTVTALARPGVDAVVVRHDAGNVRSEAVPRRLGFLRRRAETRDSTLASSTGVTVQWEADRTWRPPPWAYSAKTPTGQETPVPPSPQ